MAQSDRAAVHIDLVPVESELATIRQCLGGERLVDLDQVERLNRQLDTIEQSANARNRCEEEPFGSISAWA